MLIYGIYYLLAPFFWLFLQIARWFNPKIAEHLRTQNSSVQSAVQSIQQKADGRKIVLFHGASAGEFEQVKPLLSRIDRTKYFCIQSFMSPTIYSQEKNTSLVDAVCYFPFDLPWAVHRFYKNINPDIMVITRHDLWPHMIRFTKAHDIKLFFVNANIHEHSLWIKFWIKSLSRFLFSFFSTITTSSERLQFYLSKIVSKENIIITGDTRFDRIQDRKNNQKPILPTPYSSTQNIIFGSIDSHDIPIIFKAIQSTFPSGDDDLKINNIKLIIVPHETDSATIEVIRTKLQALQIHPVLFSNMNEQQPAECIIVDQVGLLADLYSIAELAYVGAGFGLGVHSVIEPAIHECAVAHGPTIHILDEAVSMVDLGLSTLVNNSDDLILFFNLLHQPDLLKSIQKKTHQFVLKHKSCSQSILNIICPS